MGFREDIAAYALEYIEIKGKPVILEPHQLDWLEQIHHGGKRILVLAPRGHGKSVVTIVYIMYRICMDPDIKILMASHVESVAKLQARAIQVYVELPKIQEAFGFEKGRPWSVSTFHFKGKIQPVMATVAARGGMIGKRFDIVIFDDLLSLENCRTENIRDKILEWIRGEVIPALDPFDPDRDEYDKEKMIVIGTRKHMKDWYSQLLESKLYTKVTDIVYTTDDKGNKVWLWPKKFHQDVLDMRLIELGPRIFAQEYFNEVTPSEGSAFRREWLKYFDALPNKRWLKYAMGVDPSWGSKEKRASSLAIAVIAYDTRPDFHHIYVVYLFKDKMTVPEQEQKMQEVYEKYKPISTNIEAVLVDTKFSERMIAQIPGAYPIDYMHTKLKGTSDVHKENRIRTLIGYYFEDGIVSLRDPNYDDAAREFIETEYIEFPTGEKDLLDALNLAVDLVEFERWSDEPIVKRL